MLSKCDAIGNEGGAVNMAKALSVPTFRYFLLGLEKKPGHYFKTKVIEVYILMITEEIYLKT